MPRLFTVGFLIDVLKFRSGPYQHNSSLHSKIPTLGNTHFRFSLFENIPLLRLFQVHRRLKSILTISRDLSYGEIIRISYRNSPVKVYHLPSFINATRIVQSIQPEILILDVSVEDFAATKSFLVNLLGIRNSVQSYIGDVFLEQVTAARLRELAELSERPYRICLPGKVRDIGVVVEPFELQDLIQKLDIAIQKIYSK